MTRRITPLPRNRNEQPSSDLSEGASWDPVRAAEAVAAMAPDDAGLVFEALVFWHLDRHGKERPVLMPLRRSLPA